jgi:hypothetical protein
MDDDAITLDPPGSIAVVGAGALGIEAALYGRFLGYDVLLIEAVAIGHSMRDQQELPLPMLPDRCSSPLALAALKAQQHGRGDGDDTPDQLPPMTYRQWIDNVLVPLTETDLLHARLRIPRRVTNIVTIPVELQEEDGEDSDEIPPDFHLTLLDEEGHTETLDAEAVILAIGSSCDIQLGFDPPVPFFDRIAATSTGEAEQDFLQGLREIVAIFACLAGRSSLDLYRPRRV